MADQCKVSAAIVAESEERSYVFKVHGYSRAKELFKHDKCLKSPPCSPGGYNWALWYFPNGNGTSAGDILLALCCVGAKDVKTKARLSILDKDGLPAPPHIHLRKETIKPEIGQVLFFVVKQASLEQSAHIIDDCCSIRCDFTLTKDLNSEEAMGNKFVVVPPSDLHLHFGKLLQSMIGADVTFHVGGEKFLAHRFVLAARSSVFNAELLGAMKENNVGSPIEIHEMEADVFKCLLHFIYTDSLPALEMACNPGETRPDVAMAGHLLVAADRYNVMRLKLMCEHKLCSHIDANMVATSLALADQHNCTGLKKACLQFLASPSNLEAMMSSDGYEHLKSSCPSALKEFIASLLPVEMKAAKDILMEI